MSNIYTWVIDSLDCIPSSDGKSNVVSNVHWRVTAISDKGLSIKNAANEIIIVPFAATTYGTQSLIYTTENTFISYDNLTQSTVIEWIKSAMGAEQIASIQNNLDNQLASLANPPIVTPPLPW